MVTDGSGFFLVCVEVRYGDTRSRPSELTSSAAKGIICTEIARNRRCLRDSIVMSSGRPRRRATTELQGKVRVKPVDELRRRWASGSNSTFSRDETASTEELDLDVDRIQDEVKLNWLTTDIALRVDADPLKDLRVKGSISRF